MRYFVNVLVVLTTWCISVSGQQLMSKGKIALYHSKTGGTDKLSIEMPRLFLEGGVENGAFHSAFLPTYSANLEYLKPGRLAPDFYYTHCYGFFCKMEWLTQSQWHIPLSFRLGSYHYERRLEGEE